MISGRHHKKYTECVEGDRLYLVKRVGDVCFQLGDDEELCYFKQSQAQSARAAGFLDYIVKDKVDHCCKS